MASLSLVLFQLIHKTLLARGNQPMISTLVIGAPRRLVLLRESLLMDTIVWLEIPQLTMPRFLLEILNCYDFHPSLAICMIQIHLLRICLHLVRTILKIFIALVVYMLAVNTIRLVLRWPDHGLISMDPLKMGKVCRCMIS